MINNQVYYFPVSYFLTVFICAQMWIRLTLQTNLPAFVLVIQPVSELKNFFRKIDDFHVIKVLLVIERTS